LDWGGNPSDPEKKDFKKKKLENGMPSLMGRERSQKKKGPLTANCRREKKKKKPFLRKKKKKNGKKMWWGPVEYLCLPQGDSRGVNGAKKREHGPDDPTGGGKKKKRGKGAENPEKN